MAKFPTADTLGPTPNIDANRGVASYDLGPIAQGNRALEAGGEAAGAGVDKAAAGATDIAVGQSRYQFMLAHANYLAQAMDLHTSFANDTDFSTLPDRYKAAATGLRDQTAQTIDSPGLRARFLATADDTIARGNAWASARAADLSHSNDVATVDAKGDQLAGTFAGTQDEPTRHRIIGTYGALVDSLQGTNAISAVQAYEMKHRWGHQVASADALTRIQNGDAEGVLNELRAAPSSNDQIDNRIIQVESNGNPLAKSGAMGSHAVGLGQFEPDTWRALIKQTHPELADLPDDQLLALRADPRLSREMVSALREQNTQYLQGKGVEATPGNIYLAHFLGPAGAAAIAKASPNMPASMVLSAALGPEKAAAMVRANPRELGGMTAGSVAQWANDRMGGVGPGGGHLYDLLRADERAQLTTHALAAVQKQQVNDDATFKQRYQDSVSEALTTGTSSQPLTQEDFVRAYGPEKAFQAYKDYQGQLTLGADRQRVAQMSPDEQQKLFDSYTPQPGSEGYAAAEKRQEIIGKQIEHVQQLRAQDPEFKQRVNDTIAESQRTGSVAKPIGADEFKFRFGNEEGPKAYAQYSASLRLGSDVKRVEDMSPQEQTAMLGGYDPQLQGLMYGADYTDAAKRQEIIGKAIQQARSDRDADPAGYAIRYLPAVQDAYRTLGAALSDPTVSPADRAAAARDYAVKQNIEQQRVGVAPEDVKLLPQSYVDAFNKSVTTAANADDATARVALIGRVQQEAAQWGDAWPQVMRQLAPGSQPMVRAIAAGADPNAMTRLLSLGKDEKPAELLKQQSETKASDLTKNIDSAMAPFLGSLVGRQRDRDFTGYYNMATQLGALYVRDGMGAPEAAQKAFNDLVGNRYDFRDSYRIPKSSGVSPDDVQAGAFAARTRLDSFNVKPAIDDIGLGETNTADSLQKFGRDGRWVTSPDQSGLNLAYGDKFVRTNDGAPLKLTWDQLTKLGTGARADAAEQRALAAQQ
jgi:hypothetical protein